MTIKLDRHPAETGLRARVESLSGVDLGRCLQCQKCAAGCPMAGLSDMPPAEVIRRLQLGGGDEMLESEMVWMCLSCRTCYARCPMDLDAASVMDALRRLALEKGARAPRDITLFNRTFLGMVRRFGRSYDLPTLALYKLGTGRLRDDLAKLPAMLRKGKMAVLPPRGADWRMVARIFTRTRRQKGGQR